MAKINEIDITSLLFQEGSAPTTPASTKWRAYFKTDGLYVIDDAGTETGPLGTGGGGGGDLVEIETISLGADGTFTFSSIPSTYRDLVIVGRLRDDASAETVASLHMRVGNTSVDTGTNYTSFTAAMRGDATGNVSSVSKSGTSGYVGRTCVANTATANRYTPFSVEIIDYATTGHRRVWMSRSSDLVPSADGQRISFANGEWHNTADAIDTVQILGDSLGDFKSGSKLTLYGRGTP